MVERHHLEPRVLKGPHLGEGLLSRKQVRVSPHHWTLRRSSVPFWTTCMLDSSGSTAPLGSSPTQRGRGCLDSTNSSAGRSGFPFLLTCFPPAPRGAIRLMSGGWDNPSFLKVGVREVFNQALTDPRACEGAT